MAELSLQDSFLLEKVIDPNSTEYAYMLQLLMSDATDDRSPAQKLRSKGKFKYTLPYRGDPEEEVLVRELTPFKFADKGTFRNGIAALALSTAEMLDLAVQSSGKNRIHPAVVATGEVDGLRATLGSSGGISAQLHFTDADNLVYNCLSVSPDTLIFDHTSICAPIDEVLNMAYRAGIEMVEGVFPYHIAAVRGWDCVAGVGNWSYTHHKGEITVGPNDDPTRLMRYKKADYHKFIDPSRWSGNARKYGYELRLNRNGLVTYMAIYLGNDAEKVNVQDMIFSLPLCSSDDMVLITINRELAAGVFASQSNNAQELARLERNYAIEVRKGLFTSCVDFLIARQKGTDLMGDAVRYITQHNYVDLADGVQITRCAALPYADALCTAMVCALTAFRLRYRLTNESLPAINSHVSAAQHLVKSPFGALGRLVWYMGNYVSQAWDKVEKRSAQAAREALFGAEYIPGVCFDVYSTTTYKPDGDWYEPATLTLDEYKGQINFANEEPDAITRYMADSVKTSAPTAHRVETPSIARIKPLPHPTYKHKYDPDPESTLQHVYDQAFPGNSVGQIQNAAELKRVKDVNISTEFYGRIEINKDVAAPELLHPDTAVRTAALPITPTSLLDAMTASAKRNFNPPDLQVESDPWAYAKYLVDRFVEFAFEPNFDKTMGESYRKDPITFSVTDYFDWRAGKDKAYKSALEAECPEELVALELEKYDTIVKKRVKPKLSTTAQHELSQPQVIVSMPKKDTAIFSSVFRRMFERFEACLRTDLKSAGRSSDKDITDWLTERKDLLLSLEGLEIDSGKYDKSQGLLARMMESLLFQRLGLDPNVLELYQDSYVGRVQSKTLGIMFMCVYQMKSGAPDTMVGNIMYNFLSTMECVGPQNIRAMIAKGDDNIVWVLPGVDKTGVVDRMSTLFNLECKLITGQVWYFSSGYIVVVEGRLMFVPDPLKMIELLGERGHDPRTIDQRFISFQDRVATLTSDASLPEMLQQVVRLRYKINDLAIVQAVDALASMASDITLYKKIVAS